jgi:hypothetical protein
MGDMVTARRRRLEQGCEAAPAVRVLSGWRDRGGDRVSALGH